VVAPDNIPIRIDRTRNTREKQWDETRVIAITGVAKVFHEHFSVLINVDGFKKAWLLLLQIFEEFVLNCNEEVVMASIQRFVYLSFFFGRFFL